MINWNCFKETNFSYRFVTESEIKAEEMISKKMDTNQIVVERTKILWKPHSLLCKRYNIAEPFKGVLEDDKKSKTKQKKMSVFDYLETSVNKKEDFQTPVIIPKNIEKPKEIVKQQTASDTKNDNNVNESNSRLEWQEVLNPTAKSQKEKKSFAFKPKTDLEKMVVESFDKPVTEKKELFKAIFSDSETDDEEQEKEKEESTKELLAATNKPLTAAAANLLRNNSPPRGIFKALFNTNTSNITTKEPPKPEESNDKAVAENLSKIPMENPKIIFQPKSSREIKDPINDEEIPIDVYGPALPKALNINKPLETTARKISIDDKLLDLFNKHKPQLKVTEKWIEKVDKNDSSDSDSSTATDDSHASSSSGVSAKPKKKSKKTKKKKSSSTDHKHKKHKEYKTSKKSRKQYLPKTTSK